MDEEACDKIVNTIMKIYTDQMLEEHQLITVGAGGGGPGKLRMLSVCFETYKKCDLQQARFLLIDCVKKFLKIINAHSVIEKCSRDFPYTDKNVSVSIMFVDSERNKFVSPPFIAIADADESNLIYRTYPNNRLTFIQEETYEEALEKAKR